MSTTCPRPLVSRARSAAITANAVASPATPSASASGGSSGGPPGSPFSSANPLIASASVPKPGREAYGPVCPNPVTRATTSRSLSSISDAGSSPQRSSVPGRKFSISTSASAVSRRTIAAPSGRERSTATSRLLRESVFHQSPTPSFAGPWPRAGSGRRGCSSLITSAPKSPSSIPLTGPAKRVAASITRRPSSGPLIGGLPRARRRSGSRSATSARGRRRAARASPCAPASARRRRGTSPSPRRGSRAALQHREARAPVAVLALGPVPDERRDALEQPASPASCHSSSVGSRAAAPAGVGAGIVEIDVRHGARAVVRRRPPSCQCARKRWRRAAGTPSRPGTARTSPFVTSRAVDREPRGRGRARLVDLVVQPRRQRLPLLDVRRGAVGAGLAPAEARAQRARLPPRPCRPGRRRPRPAARRSRGAARARGTSGRSTRPPAPRRSSRKRENDASTSSGASASTAPIPCGRDVEAKLARRQLGAGDEVEQARPRRAAAELDAAPPIASTGVRLTSVQSARSSAAKHEPTIAGHGPSSERAASGVSSPSVSRSA